MATVNHILALSGGVGGAKLALGLNRVLPPEQFTVVANTGDDFQHFGLHISPDIDTVLYTLSGLSNTELGWGQAQESWNFLDAMARLGGDSWFRLGDRDMATHIRRGELLASGQSLTEVTAYLCKVLGIRSRLLPMTDDPVATEVHSDEGVLPFQHYFVRRQCEPRVSGFEFKGINKARPQADFLKLLHSDSLAGIIICPSNPYVSIDPILKLSGVREAMQASAAPVIAVSPIVAGVAIKGPAAKMMQELEVPASAVAVAEHYRGLVDGFVVDESDATLAAQIEEMGMQVSVTRIIMTNLAEREALAQCVLRLVESVR